MTIFSIRKFGDPVLRQPAKKIEASDKELEQLVASMAETMYAAPGLGLAANQIGILKQVFVFDEGSGLMAYMNPEIIEAEGEIEEDEGCLSVASIQVPVKRYEKIKVRAQTLDGEEHIIEAEGFTARILQHEIDHLNGKIILDRLSETDRRRAIQEFHEKEGLL